MTTHQALRGRNQQQPMLKFLYKRTQLVVLDAPSVSSALLELSAKDLQAPDDVSLDTGTLSVITDAQAAAFEDGDILDGPAGMALPEWPFTEEPAAFEKLRKVVDQAKKIEADALADSRWHHGDKSQYADVFTNAPLALVQLEMSARLSVAQHLLQLVGEPTSNAYTKREHHKETTDE
jgi:hypothetical protein